MNFKRMIQDIDKLVKTDFAFDMECKLIPDSMMYTQEEAKQMADIISSVYAISHCEHCKSCSKKYENT